MGEVYNRGDRTDLLRQLRADAPTAEQRLWLHLRNKQLGGVRFRRQYSVGPYVLDFCCPAARLGIEIDGPSHFDEGAEERDARRTEYLAAHGIRVVRFTNQEVYEQMDAVLERILEESGGSAGGSAASG